MNKEEARKQIGSSYFTLGNISQVARLWHISRNVVRKWVKRFEQKGEEGFRDESKKPRSSPEKVSQEVEHKVLEDRKRTGYGRKRPAWYLAREEGLVLSPNTIRHILSRNGFKWRRKPKKGILPCFLGLGSKEGLLFSLRS